MTGWRKQADLKTEDLRRLLIDLDFKIQEAPAIACREILSKIEAKTHEIRVILAPHD
jgi:hypothetical protein